VQPSERKLSQLRQLEAESIQIIREAAAEFDNPVMMYSVGKDSTAMLRLAEKAFAPGPLPFPLLHVDTTWKFQDMYRYRDKIEATVKAELIKHVNEEGVAMGMTATTSGTQRISAPSFGTSTTRRSRRARTSVSSR
jgi:sulfate adenylyltransferase subunit 2